METGATQSGSGLPASLGAYRPIRVLGSGGMGVVYAALDPRLDRIVAVKLLRPHLLDSDEALSRFQREARLLAALTHPGIATVYAFEQTPSGERMLVMELVEGRTLADRLRDGPLPLSEAIRIVADVADALAAAHAAGIAHRDLKPGNIMLTPTGSVKVLDFGMAKSIGDAGASRTSDPTMSIGVTSPGAILGTPAYMAPEQARGQGSGQRADLFALGCILFECLAGVRVFAGETPADAIAQVLGSDPPWHALPDGTPDSVRDLIRRCLTKDVGVRTITAAEVAKALGAVAGKPDTDRRAVFVTERGAARGLKDDDAVCGRCGYSVRGAPSFTCPECGSDLRTVGIVRAAPFTVPSSIRAAVNAAGVESGSGWLRRYGWTILWSSLLVVALVVAALVLIAFARGAASSGPAPTPTAVPMGGLVLLSGFIAIIAIVVIVVVYSRRAKSDRSAPPSAPEIDRPANDGTLSQPHATRWTLLIVITSLVAGVIVFLGVIAMFRDTFATKLMVASAAGFVPLLLGLIAIIAMSVARSRKR